LLFQTYIVIRIRTDIPMNLNLQTNHGNKENTLRLNKLISEIRNLINHKNLQSGDKLPSERILSEKFDVGRRSIRAAILKLESFGILKSIPQSGTFVADIGSVAMNGMIEDILSLGTPNFRSLVQVRILLELEAVSLAASNRSEEALDKIKSALTAHRLKLESGQDAVQEDLLFHLAIAKASGNEDNYAANYPRF